LKQIIADTIRAERKKAGLTQDQLASEMDMSTRFYQTLEAGSKKPGLLTLFKLCKALKINYTVILDPVWKSWIKK